MRRAALSMTLAAASLACLASACSGGGGGGGGSARVFGRVENETGAGIDDADVTLAGGATSTTLGGGFQLQSLKTGWAEIEVVATGYRSVTSEIKLASGDNSVEIIMVACTPGIDAGCATPTPTETPTPTPAPNVVATFTGVNGNPDPVTPANSVFGNWAGAAILTRPSPGAPLNLGNDADAADLAFPECWLDANQTNDWDGMGTPDHCLFWWEGENQGGIVDPGLNDAVFYVRIPGDVFMAGMGDTLTFADGITAGYYEGDFTVDGFQIGDYTLQRAATSGTLTLGNVGMNDGQNVSITGQATFYIPNLP